METMKLLQDQYDRKQKITAAYRDKSLSSFSLFLVDCHNAMEDIDYLDEMDNWAKVMTDLLFGDIKEPVSHDKREEIKISGKGAKREELKRISFAKEEPTNHATTCNIEGAFLKVTCVYCVKRTTHWKRVVLSEKNLTRTDFVSAVWLKGKMACQVYSQKHPS